MRSKLRRTLVGLGIRCLAFALSLSSGCGPAKDTQLQPDADVATAVLDEHADPAAFDSAVPSEPSFTEQAASVRRGESPTIRLTLSTITASELIELGELTDLEELLLDTGGINDNSIAALNKLIKLEHLRLRNSRLTDAGIAQLDPSQLSKLKILNLPQAELTAVSIQHLAKFPELIQLRLGGKGLDDAAAEALTALPRLRSLHVIGPRFSDAALESLGRIPKLASLYVDDCHLSDEAWQRLFQAKPNLHVHIDQQHHDRDPNHAHDAANE